MTSLAAIFNGTGKPFELRSIETPKPKGEEILVRVLGCTLCGSDLHSFEGRRAVQLPTILGHEIVGEIVAFGGSAARIDMANQTMSLGDRVTWSLVASCKTCFYCLRGLPQKCVRAIKYGHEPLREGMELLGGMAEHCLLVPGTAIVRLPEELPLSVACPASCATSTVAAALSSSETLQNKNACIFGMGLLGLTAAAMLRAAGASNIVCVDPNEARLSNAIRFGATEAVLPDQLPKLVKAISEDHGFDLVLECSGSPAAFLSGWKHLRKGGTFVLVGAVFPTSPVEIAMEEIVRRNLTIRGIHNYTPIDLLHAIQFLAQHHHQFPFSEIVSTWLPLSESDKAFELSKDPARIRVGMVP